MSTTDQHAPIDPHAAAAEADAADLAARYGRTPGSLRKKRWIAGIVGATVAVAVVAWVVWVGLFSGTSEIEVEDTGHSVVSDSLVQVRYQLTVEPGETVSCAAQALNSTFGVVGWKVVDVPASDRRTRTLGVDVRTTELPVTGLIYRCWLT
ncbi:MAG: hypothetical protein JWM50_1123 [Microbacteriaceae bacterium]|nr:hypothetical protein [Microbacteriaceae bacterium]